MSTVPPLPPPSLPRILVCSTSEIKIGAVRNALAQIGLPVDAHAVRSIDVDSEVPPQPFGAEETARGAWNRALTVHVAHPDCLIVAIENGIRKVVSDLPGVAPAYVDVAVVAIAVPDAAPGLANASVVSRAVPVPADLVEASRAQAFQVTCGALESRRTPGAAPGDPHVVWSRGTTSRREILSEAVVSALRSAGVTRHHDALPGGPPDGVLVTIAGVSRHLPVRQAAPGVHRGALSVWYDPELSRAVGQELARLLPDEVDVLVTADDEARWLVPDVQNALDREIACLDVKGDTSEVYPTLRARLQGKAIALLAVVAPSGEILDRLWKLLAIHGAARMYILAVATTGDRQDEDGGVISLVHLETFRT